MSETGDVKSAQIAVTSGSFDADQRAVEEERKQKFLPAMIDRIPVPAGSARIVSDRRCKRPSRLEAAVS